jgi:transcriptional pleiotropic regulator of transition state genes
MIKGIVRKIDKLGRIVPPKEFRIALGITEGSEVDMYLDGKIIRVRLAQKPYKGIVRGIESLGRVDLPIEYRRSLRLGQCDAVDMWLNGEEICISRATLQCVICESEDESSLMEVDGVLICRPCAVKVIDKFSEE